jgi:hypothetical protein
MTPLCRSLVSAMEPAILPRIWVRTIASTRFQSANSHEIALTWLKMTCTKSVSGVFTRARPFVDVVNDCYRAAERPVPTDQNNRAIR